MEGLETTAIHYDPNDSAIKLSIDNVRRRLKDYEIADVHIGSDHRVFRFLVARDFDIDKAAEMLAADVEWRLEVKSEELTPADCPNEIKTGKAYWHGYDGYGHPILLFFPCHHWPKESDPDEVEKFYLFLMEEGVRRMPPGITQFTVVYDRTDYSYSNFDRTSAQTLARIVQDHYPERLYQACICEVNWLFHMVYKIVSLFIDARTKQKVAVMSGDWREQLRQFIDPSQLLEKHGGTSAYQYKVTLAGMIDQTNLPEYNGHQGGDPDDSATHLSDYNQARTRTRSSTSGPSPTDTNVDPSLGGMVARAPVVSAEQGTLVVDPSEIDGDVEEEGVGTVSSAADVPLDSSVAMTVDNNNTSAGQPSSAATESDIGADDTAAAAAADDDDVDDDE